MKSLLIIALITLSAGSAFGQIKVKPKIKLNTKGTKIVAPKVTPETPAPGTNSAAPAPQATESNRKRPGGTINTNSNSMKVEGEEPKKVEKKKQ